MAAVAKTLYAVFNPATGECLASTIRSHLAAAVVERDRFYPKYPIYECWLRPLYEVEVSPALEPKRVEGTRDNMTVNSHYNACAYGTCADADHDCSYSICADVYSARRTH